MTVRRSKEKVAKPRPWRAAHTIVTVSIALGAAALAKITDERGIESPRSDRSRRKIISYRPETTMKLKIVVHEAEEGGYWAEVPSIPGCATQGETFEELLKNLYEAVEGCLSVEVSEPKATGKDRVVEIIV